MMLLVKFHLHHFMLAYYIYIYIYICISLQSIMVNCIFSQDSLGKQVRANKLNKTYDGTE